MAKAKGTAGRTMAIPVSTNYPVGSAEFDDIINEFTDRVRLELGLDQFEVSENSSTGYLVLSRIRVRPEDRGQGKGDRAMRELTAFADKYNRTLVLSPEPLDEASYTRGYARGYKRLVAWYKEYGFRMNRGRYIDFATSEKMIRTPHV